MKLIFYLFNKLHSHAVIQGKNWDNYRYMVSVKLRKNYAFGIPDNKNFLYNMTKLPFSK
jgi:hypothetical protein